MPSTPLGLQPARLARAARTLLIAFGAALLYPHTVLAHDLVETPVARSESVVDAGPETLTGSVHALVVDDPAHGTSHRYVDLELDDGTLVPLRGDGTPALEAGARASVTGHRNGKWLDVVTAQTAGSASRNVPKANAEVEGSFAILHADDFAHGHSVFIYQVRQASGKVNRLRLAMPPSELEPGTRVRVVGSAEADGESITPDRITILSRAASSSKAEGAIAKAAVANRVLVIMANFNNTAAPAYRAAQAQQVMTSNADSVANFFREASFGQQVMNVTVTPAWVTMNMAYPATCRDSDWGGIATRAEAAATALGAGYDSDGYDYVVYVFPTVSACGWLGLAYVGQPHKAWINGVTAFRTQAVAHEMGHNFGLLHAASLRCSGAVIGGSCSASEYGDPFDTMGNQRAMHYNAVQKSRLGWIPPTSVATYGGGAVTYTLSPLEVGGASTYAVKIPTGSVSRTYWLEFRQPIGFDSPLSAFPNNGAQIRVSSPFETMCPGCDMWSIDTELIDATPGTSTFTDATLTAGQTFSDPNYGINVTVLSATPSALTVQVATGNAAPPAPPAPATTTTSVSSTANPATSGATITLTGFVNGSAPTGSVRFTDNGSTIAGCGAVVLAGSGNTRSASCVTNALMTGSHAIVASYGGDAANKPSTGAPLAEVVNAPIDGTNVALAANGGVASASTTLGPSFAPSGVIDDRRSGAGWGVYAGWADATAGAFPDWLQVNFNGTRTIDHVVVYSVQDNYMNPAEPTDSMTGTLYVISSFDVQAWNGSAWTTIASVSGNNLIKRTVWFAPRAMSSIRISVTGTQDGVWSRITQVEAWGQ
jgi:M6 family metalloprotease-like protein